MEKLIWHCEKRKVSDLIPYCGNPRQMTAKQVEDLKLSLERLNLIDIPAIDTDGILVGGHQRCKILIMLGRGDEEIDVRVPNRKLTEDEFREANLRLNKNLGEFDPDLLVNFDTDLLKFVGFSDEELTSMFQLDMGPGSGGDDNPKPEKNKKISCPECGHEFEPSQAGKVKL